MGLESCLQLLHEMMNCSCCNFSTTMVRWVYRCSWKAILGHEWSTIYGNWGFHLYDVEQILSAIDFNVHCMYHSVQLKWLVNNYTLSSSSFFIHLFQIIALSFNPTHRPLNKFTLTSPGE